MLPKKKKTVFMKAGGLQQLPAFYFTKAFGFAKNFLLYHVSNYLVIPYGLLFGKTSCFPKDDLGYRSLPLHLFEWLRLLRVDSKNDEAFCRIRSEYVLDLHGGLR
jgi:hypothetical protein